MKYGYARVSTDDQNADTQRAALKKAGCAIFTGDGISGATAKRPALLRCLKTLERGDSLTVWTLAVEAVRARRAAGHPGGGNGQATAEQSTAGYFREVFGRR